MSDLRLLGRREWRYAIRRSIHGFVRARGIDSAAALTFFATLSLFPVALTLVSAVAVVDGKPDAVSFLLTVAGAVLPASAVNAIRTPLEQLTQLPNPAMAVLVGLLLSLWTVSAFATAFGRALNSLYEVQEGRRIVKFRSLMLLVTLLLLLGSAAIALILMGTPSVATAVGDALGFGEPWLSLWNLGKWPVLAVLAGLLVGVLYYWTPNVRRQTASWFSIGATLAVAAWGLATTAFLLYVTSIGLYDEVYGWLGGAVVTLLWGYLTNLILLWGASLDAEVVRTRHLRTGIESEQIIRVPLRDTARTITLARRRAADEAEGRRIREEADRTTRPQEGQRPQRP